MSHKVPEDGGARTRSYAREPLRRGSYFLDLSRASYGFYVCMRAHAETTSATVSTVRAVPHRFPIIPGITSTVSLAA